MTLNLTIRAVWNPIRTKTTLGSKNFGRSISTAPSRKWQRSENAIRAERKPSIAPSSTRVSFDAVGLVLHVVAVIVLLPLFMFTALFSRYRRSCWGFSFCFLRGCFRLLLLLMLMNVCFVIIAFVYLVLCCFLMMILLSYCCCCCCI